MKTNRETDVFVAGGGPVGLAAAISARLAGFRVILAEQRMPPIDKACGEGIMPDGVEILERLGVSLPPGGAFPFAGIRFIEGGIRATARFSRRPGLGVRRTVLHRALIRRAAELEVRFLWGRKVRSFHSGGRIVELDRGWVATRWLLAADGLNSGIRRLAGLDVPPVYRRFGMRRHFEVRPWSEYVEVYWSPIGEAYVTPVDSGTICIAVLHRDPDLGFDAALPAFPELARRIGSAPGKPDDRRAGTVFRRVPRVTRDRIALVGDAAGSVDAITGEGITVGLHQVAILTRCLRMGGLKGYEPAHRRLMRLPNGMTSFMLGINRRPRLRRGTLRVLENAPVVFSQLLKLHTRSLFFSHPGGRSDAAHTAGSGRSLPGRLPIPPPSWGRANPNSITEERP